MMDDRTLPKGSVYDQHTWPEIRDLQKAERVAIIPVGSVEQHGHHLPLDTDEVLVWSVCSEHNIIMVVDIARADLSVQDAGLTL